MKRGRPPISATMRDRIRNLVDQNFSNRAIAETLGLNKDTVRKYRQPMILRQQSTKDGDVVWEKHVRSGQDPSTVEQIPAGVLSRTSTLFDREGNIAARWEIIKPEEKRRWETLKAWADELIKVVPMYPRIAQPREALCTDLLATYWVGDHHNGMLAWKHETGESYDIDLAEDILARAVDSLVASAPPADQALIGFMGDFFHYDSFDQVTPTHRNLLDADGRAPKMISAGMRMIERTATIAAQKHRLVRLIFELGNHDPYTSMVMARLMARVYQDNPRISVDINPSHFHYFEWGNVLLGTHHGHGRVAKAKDLPGIMAHDMREAWGRTKYHYWHTGHVHHQSVYEFPGCLVESHRILPPPDAYAFNEGYRAGRDMKEITYHREFGERGRITVNPDMLRSST